MKTVQRTVGTIFALYLVFILSTSTLAPIISTPIILAQDPIEVVDQAWAYDFRDNITFTLNAQGTSEITEVDLLYRIVGQLATSRNEAEFIPGQTIEAQFSIDQVDTTADSYTYFPPGTELEYWWKLTDTDGNELKTEREIITYLDNRYEWQTLENDRVTLYWYDGDSNFGEALFERANIALDTLETDIGISLENPIKIFIYGGHNDLLNALSVTAQEWTGGVAFTEYGTVIIGIRSNQLAWGLNAMTHEMSHLVIHQATDNPFTGLPRWLDEGIAVYNENQEELDQDFKPLFDRAVANDELMTLRTLSSPFPADPAQTNLAYGQSGSVVKFIVDTYGSDKMAELLAIFGEGAIPDEALQEVLGLDTIGLDNQFRASVNLPPLPGTAPIETTDTTESETAAEVEEPAVSEVEEPTENTEAAETGSTSTEPEENTVTETEATSAPVTSDESDQSRSPLNALPCLGGIIIIAMMGWGVIRRVV